jgi:hypothetical protein
MDLNGVRERREEERGGDGGGIAMTRRSLGVAGIAYSSRIAESSGRHVTRRASNVLVTLFGKLWPTRN